MPIDLVIYTLLGVCAVATVIGVVAGKASKEGVVGAGVSVWTWFFLFGIWLWGWIIYVAVHFIGKYW